MKGGGGILSLAGVPALVNDTHTPQIPARIISIRDEVCKKFE